MPREKNSKQNEPLTKSDWIQYLSHVASYCQNYSMGFANIFFAIIAILVVIIGFPEIPVYVINTSATTGFVITSRPILSIVVIIFIILIIGIPKRINYGKEALLGKTANRILSNIFSNQYPELKTSKGIQKKWNSLKQKINNTDVQKRKELLKEKTKKITDDRNFDDWFNDTS
jgi:hypothetical protein